MDKTTPPFPPVAAADHREAGRLPSPAEAAIAAAGVQVDRREAAQLLRLVERRLPADEIAVRAALCEVRRRSWSARLNDLATRAGRFWVRRSDTQAAAAAVDHPDASDEVLLSVLDAVLAERLLTAGPTPEAALEAVAAEAMDAAQGAMSPDRHADLAYAVASAHGMGPAEARIFAASAAGAEDRRRQERRAAEKAARDRKREEIARLRQWEKSLVGFKDIPGILGCSEKELLRWVASGLIPVARRVPQKDGREHWEFNPVDLAPLRDEVSGWREAEAEVRARRSDASQGSRSVPALHLGRSGNAAVARVAALDRYAAHFSTARALKRRITLVTGPTNSGKSHTALDRLAAAGSGIALAPLRLLAHEFREALGARGVPASLSTGEERITVPGSRHLAATVEMCPFRNPVDVAIVDECQMLHDRDRGAAWTAAIMGAPARDLFVLGAPDGAPMVRRIAALCGDLVDEVSLERKGPLVVARQPVPLGSLAPGDALIAFSRREVLDLRAELVRRGKRVAVVYGALSPEVRRAEAARFNSGDADILVATDAIGMGLNLSIRRVVFAALRKFDGTERRELSSQEVKQIGGRAGRYGRFEEGVIAVLAGGGSPEFVERMLAAPPAPPADLRPQVQPDADIVAAVSAEIGSDSLFGVLARIKRAVLRKDDPNYRLADMTQAMAVASAVDGVGGLALLDRWSYALCPVDERDDGVNRLARWAVEHGAGRLIRPPTGGRLPAPERAQRDELERAEKVHKRLVAWRWLSLRFPQAYPDMAAAEAETARLDRWIEDVLREQRRGRSVLAA